MRLRALSGVMPRALCPDDCIAHVVRLTRDSFDGPSVLRSCSPSLMPFDA